MFQSEQINSLSCLSTRKANERKKLGVEMPIIILKNDQYRFYFQTIYEKLCEDVIASNVKAVRQLSQSFLLLFNYL